MRRALTNPVPVPSPTPQPGSTPTPSGTPTPTPSGTPTPAPGGTPTPSPIPDPGYAGSWQSGPAISDGPACSTTAPATRDVKCVDGAGEEIETTHCNPATRPSTVVTVEDLSSCTSEWKTGDWDTENHGQTCSNYTQFREVWCERSDGSISGPYSGGHQCNMAQMPSRERVEFDPRGCTYRWDYGVYGDWSSTCSSSAERTRPVNGCLRVETAEILPTEEESNCSEAKDVKETSGVYTSCTYTATAYGPWSSCINGTRTAQPTACQRSDTTMVATSFCSAKEEACTPQSCSTNFTQNTRTVQQSDLTLSAHQAIVILPNATDWKEKAAAACSAHGTPIIACFVNHLPDGRVNVIQHKTTPTIVASTTTNTNWTSICTAN